MYWIERWRFISARIDGFFRAGEFYLKSLGNKASDHLNIASRAILPEIHSIISELREFHTTYQSDLPPQAKKALEKFLLEKWDNSFDPFLKVLVPFEIFRNRFEYLIKDSEVEVRNLTELAFEHLRRLIVVSEDFGKMWNSAFDERETSCEKLGAVHLLSHGIWAFKVSASGGATDLVYNDPTQGHSEKIRRTARGLVLTEWKKVLSAAEVDSKAKEARNQTRSYSSGVLGGMELKGTRYIVLVSKEELAPINDIVEDSVNYRHILIPVMPKSPSVAARKLAQTKGGLRK